MNYEVFSVSFSIVAGAAIALATIFLTINGAIEVFKLGVWWHKERVKYKHELSIKQPPYDEVRIRREWKPFDHIVVVELIKNGEVIHCQDIESKERI